MSKDHAAEWEELVRAALLRGNAGGRKSQLQSLAARYLIGLGYAASEPTMARKKTILAMAERDRKLLGMLSARGRPEMRRYLADLFSAGRGAPPLRALRRDIERAAGTGRRALHAPKTWDQSRGPLRRMIVECAQMWGPLTSLRLPSHSSSPLSERSAWEHPVLATSRGVYEVARALVDELSEPALLQFVDTGTRRFRLAIRRTVRDHGLPFARSPRTVVEVILAARRARQPRA